jgi:hypothetical protein
MNGLGLQERTRLTQRRRVPGEAAAVDRDGARCRVVQPQDHPDRDGLPGAVRPQEPGYRAGLHGERQVIYGDLVAVELGEVPLNVPGADSPASLANRGGHLSAPTVTTS